MNLLEFFIKDYETLQVKIPLSLIRRAEAPLTCKLHVEFSIYAINHIKRRDFDFEHK